MAHAAPGDAGSSLPGEPPGAGSAPDPREPRGTGSARDPREPRGSAADPRELAAIFAGGALGAGLRTGLVELAPPPPGHWPWVTFAVNVVGCLLLGYFVTRLQERLPITAYRRPFLGTGLCGALTTFSTMQVELLRMLDRGELGLAAGYAAGSVIAGYAAVTFATNAVRRTRLTW